MRQFSLLCAAAAALIVSPASAAQIQNYKVSNWDIGAYTNDRSGRFTHCAAAARYKNGITLLFSVSESLEWAIGFSNSEWNLREGRVIDVEFQIDGGKTTTVTGRAVTQRLVRATLPDSSELFNQFRYGNRLVARVDGNRETPFNLTATAAMLTEILNCAKKYKGHVQQARANPRSQERDTGSNDQRPQRQPNQGLGSGTYNPTDDRTARLRDRDEDMSDNQRAPQTTPQTNTAVGPTEETRTEAAAIATEIVRRANIPGFEIQKPEQQTANFRDKYDVVWKADGVTGTLRVLAGPRATTIERLRADVIASDAGSCKGRFASGVLPATSGSQSVTIQTSCEGDPTWSIYYIAVPRRKGGVYLLGIFGTGEAASRLQSVATSYRLVALEVLER